MFVNKTTHDKNLENDLIEMVKKLDDFERQQRIGRGAHGDVYLVTRKHDGKKYCLKQIELSDLTEFTFLFIILIYIVRKKYPLLMKLIYCLKQIAHT
jgi:serine/threonine protein kinase